MFLTLPTHSLLLLPTCRALASLADGYVNDAFGTSHRAHASTAGVPALLDDSLCGVGLLVDKEITYLDFSDKKPDEKIGASKFMSCHL